MDKQWQNSLTPVSSAPGEQRAAAGTAQALPPQCKGLDSHSIPRLLAAWDDQLEPMNAQREGKDAGRG